MDFFRSILADDPDPETPDNYEQSESDDHQIQLPKHHETEGDEDDDSTSNVNSSDDGSSSVAGGGLWSFGDLVKTLTTRSESVFETYRRDLKEFGTGLRKESDLFREVASRAVKELPASIDVGTSAIDVVLKSTADIIAQGKEALLQPSDVDDSYSDRSGLDSRRYSRFDAQLNAIRFDLRTYCEDPEDLEDYRNWKLGFVVEDKKDEIEKLVGDKIDNGDLAGMYLKLVPNEVDDGTFWCRYFYKVHKLKQQEDMRAKIVNRSLSVDDEEELSWDVDDDDDEDEEEEHQQQADQLRSNTSKSQDSDYEIKTQSSNIADEDKEMQTNVVSVDKNNVEEPKKDENLDLKVDSGEVKDGNVVVELNQPSFEEEEEDLEWDEIEDLGNNDDRIVSHGGTPNKADLHKRLSTAADEEDLSWDIEDDDDDKPVTAGNK
ncbi:hypothetical protein L1987_60429 [Smallanthus sonchifolius]|uniref:Uncharacterized protein n=1 Tax=Smallanthus sonchifolius TaxID=185202 RepID=A0ACB9D893_9ASTR|nr:hypothetical protein L1987_60429 [Smallanthus sonchifolius]